MKAAVPRALRTGERVAIVAPSGPVLDSDEFDAGVDVLRAWGFEPVVSPNVRAASGHLAGPDDVRAGDLNAALNDPEVRAIFAARGGYGLTRILHRIDWESLRRDPKILVGFSDVTALLVGAWQRARVASIHGPFAARLHRIAPFARTHLRRVLTNPGALATLRQPPAAPPLRTVVAGTGDGYLVGGNLSVLAAMTGTPDDLDAGDAVLLIEDVNEAPYRIDRMLVQLRAAGCLRGLQGVVVGQMVGCDPPEDRPSGTVETVVEDVLGDLGVPIISGLVAGHVDHQLAVPLGVRVRIQAARGADPSLTFLEPHLA